MAKKNKLTKSLYKTATSCPTKLFYTVREEEYANSKLDDPFLKALAKGGFQVGELAKCYFSGGHDIKTLDKKKALEETNKLLKKTNVIIYEAAIEYKDTFIRVDVLEKKGKKINLYEVKAKSTDPSTFDDEVWDQREKKKGNLRLKATWDEYILDVAFQAYVIKNSFPDYKYDFYLMLADKTKAASVEGLNQKFLLKEDKNGRGFCEVVGKVDKKSLGKEILVKQKISDIVEVIHSEKEMGLSQAGGFKKGIDSFIKSLKKEIKLDPEVGRGCKGCEFRCDEKGLKNGFNECWIGETSLNSKTIKEPLFFDVWYSPKANELFQKKKYLMKNIIEDDFDIKERDDDKEGLSRSQRQWEQVERVKKGIKKSYLDKKGLRDEMKSWKFPLHMIDFETSRVAIPFNKGKRPYEQIAFQFSHHTIDKNGNIEHKGEFLMAEPGKFPNFEFVRELQKELEKDEGTIFMYTPHENTTLCEIREQLVNSKEKDKKALIEFIESITYKKDKKDFLWYGERVMVDLCDIVIRYYYNPETKGSNSLKQVLPAVLNESKYLQKKYSKPIYGDKIPSKNFPKHVWIEKDKKGKIDDPYKTLPPVHDKYEFEEIDTLMSDNELKDGGAAMTAYAFLQFTQMSNKERENLKTALLKYCELDTMAMCFLYEALREWCKIV